MCAIALPAGAQEEEPTDPRLDDARRAPKPATPTLPVAPVAMETHGRGQPGSTARTDLEPGTQIFVRGATEPLRPDDPREAGDIVIHKRICGGGTSTLKFYGRSPSGYHFVKVLIDDALRNDFTNETTIAAKLVDAPNLPRFTGSGTVFVGGRLCPWYAQRLLGGPLLLQQLHPDGVTPERLAQLAGDLARAIAGLAERGLAHGDIKPEHIIDEQRYVLVDLGSGRSANPAEHPTSILNTGTRSYAASERQTGGPATPASDVYSWGVVIAYAARGTHPLRNGPSTDLAAVLANLPANLRDLVTASLSHDPAARPTPTELVAATTDLRAQQTAVLTNDVTDEAAPPPVVLPPGIQPVVRTLATLGDVHIGAYRAALVLVALLSAWITYALVIGG